MTLYRLLDTEEAKFLSVIGTVVACVFYVIGGILLLALRGDARIVFCMICFLAALVMTLLSWRNVRIFGQYAMLENEMLIVCTRKGRRLGKHSLEKMNYTYTFAYYGGRDIIHESEEVLVLYPKGTILKKLTAQVRGECLQYLNARSLGKKMVFIVNKELEEKILAYYGEPITEPDSTV